MSGSFTITVNPHSLRMKVNMSLVLEDETEYIERFGARRTIRIPADAVQDVDVDFHVVAYGPKKGECEVHVSTAVTGRQVRKDGSLGREVRCQPSVSLIHRMALVKAAKEALRENLEVLLAAEYSK